MDLKGQPVCHEALQLIRMDPNDATTTNDLQSSVIDAASDGLTVDVKQFSHFLNGQKPRRNQRAIAHD